MDRVIAMAQINISCDDKLVREIDRVAAARGERRLVMLRQVLEEVIEAHDAGRLSFQANDQPRIDSSLNSLAIQLREAVVELDRTQRASQRHEKKLLDLWNGGEEANQAAQERLSAQLNQIARDGYQPFTEKLKIVQETITTARTEVQASIAAKLVEIDAGLEANRVLASKPRTVHNLVLGDDRALSTKVLATVIGGSGILSILLFIAIVGQFSTLAVPVAEHLLWRSSAFCRLIDRSYETSDCVEPGKAKQTQRRADRKPK